MKPKNKKVLVTGGAGFIGSHLVDSLKENNSVLVYDNFSNPVIKKEDPEVNYSKENILNLSELIDKTKSIDLIFHYAAAPSVKKSSENPLKNFEQNVQGTLNVLEAARRNDVSRIVFASSSTIYGEVEGSISESGSFDPISNYGASKAACEMYLKSYSSTYGIQAIALRYANIFGPRSNHGVMYDFFHKLKENPDELEILGNGKQEKSYLYIDDCVKATLASLESKEDFDVFNVGSEEQLTVNQIAEIISSEMGLDPKFKYTGGERGWKGDVTKMLLDINKIKSIGWEPETSTEEGIRKYIQWLDKESS